MNYKISLSYKGTNYFGFAKQNNYVTIEQTLLDTFEELFGLKVKLFGSGRTDKYVHAYEQIINVRHEKLVYDSEVIFKALNAKLPSDIKVLSCEKVPDSFHARFNAKQKTYLYKINTSGERNIFEEDIVYQYNKKIDLVKLNQFKNIILGEHNFLSFSTSELENTIRTIYEFDYEYKNEILEIKITGNGFLRNMVRMLIGVFLDFNEDKINLEHIYSLLNNPKKGAAIRKVNGCGLYLYKVNYL